MVRAKRVFWLRVESERVIPVEDYEPEICQVCGGNGFLSAAEYECDWINYSDYDLITCPECKGDGVIHYKEEEVNNGYVLA